MLWSNYAHAPALTQYSRAREPQLLSPRPAATEACAPRACAGHQEALPQREAGAPQLRAAPAQLK